MSIKDKKPHKTDTTPAPRVHFEKIGDTEWQLEEMLLDVVDDVRLWPDNPRIQAVVEAKGSWDHVSDNQDHKPLLSVTQMANYMGKSASWVLRLRDAYEFARKFLEHVEGPEGVSIAIDEFSTLEEIMKAPVIGPRLREY